MGLHTRSLWATLVLGPQTVVTLLGSPGSPIPALPQSGNPRLGREQTRSSCSTVSESKPYFSHLRNGDGVSPQTGVRIKHKMLAITNAVYKAPNQCILL